MLERQGAAAQAALRSVQSVVASDDPAASPSGLPVPDITLPCIPTLEGIVCSIQQVCFCLVLKTTSNGGGVFMTATPVVGDCALTENVHAVMTTCMICAPYLEVVHVSTELRIQLILGAGSLQHASLDAVDVQHEASGSGERACSNPDYDAPTETAAPSQELRQCSDTLGNSEEHPRNHAITMQGARAKSRYSDLLKVSDFRPCLEDAARMHKLYLALARKAAHTRVRLKVQINDVAQATDGLVLLGM